MLVHFGQNNGDRSDNDDALRMYDSLRQVMALLHLFLDGCGRTMLVAFELLC